VETGELIKVPHVQRIKRANGRVDLYFRKGDYREGPLQSPDGSQALADEVRAILQRLEKVQAAGEPKAGTVGGLLKAYNRSAEFLALAGSTQVDYQYLIDELIETVGDVLLSDVTRGWLVSLRDLWALRGHRAANNHLQVLKNACAPVIDDDDDKRIVGDPFNKIKKVKRPHDAGEAHPIWEAAEVDAAIEAAIARKHPGLARGLALARFGGYRRGTICGLPLNARSKTVDDAGRPEFRHYWITEKRKVLADKREDARLTALLARTANKGLMLAYNGDGNAWKPRQFSQAFDRLMTTLAKAGKVRSAVDEAGQVYCPLTIHGLRHSRGVELAQAGASDAEIMAQLEHATDRAAKIYRRQAERRKLADAGQDRVDNVVRLRAKAAKRAAEAG
jgi:integrase